MIRSRMTLFTISTAILVTGLVSACGASKASDSNAHEHEHEEGSEHQDEVARIGPNGGRLLEEGDLALEILIVDGPAGAEMRIYPSQDGAPVAPSSVRTSVELARLGGKVDAVEFSTQGDYMKSNTSINEPQSFDVTVSAVRDGRSHVWTYEAHEGRTKIPRAAAAESGVGTEVAGPASIRSFVSLSGTVALLPSANADVRAVYPGRVMRVTRTVGDAIRKGETLAEIESSSSLQVYAVRAPISGTLLERRTNEGDVAASDPLFVIGDIGAVEAQLHVFPKDAALIKPGQTIRIQLAGSDHFIGSKVENFQPFANPGTQSLIARALLPRDSGFRPGMRVTAAVEVANSEVPLAVREIGLQRFRDFTVVFAKHGDEYEVRMLELGRRDGEFAEVLGGIDPGESYVTENSFLIKADIEKSGASHDH